MTADDPLPVEESWEVEVDVALAQARTVLTTATQTFSTSPDVATGIELASAWRELADAWESRQAHELELVRALEDTTDTEDEEELDVDPRRPQARAR
ncbi:MAG TPA: hypothetical protein VNG12_27770 [Acidimicrobiales bacterium]|nr:hypothetical protein [Acidimicrobiales bacterium]